jgi:hypothetical protein
MWALQQSSTRGLAVERVEAGTDDWAEMMEVTTPEFKAYRKAIAAEYNAKQRLKRATMAHLLAN